MAAEPQLIRRSSSRRGAVLWAATSSVLALACAAPSAAPAAEGLANNTATLVNQTGVRQGVYRRLFDAPGAVFSRPTYVGVEAAKRLEIVAEEGRHSYNFDFGAPTGQQLHVGEYREATRGFSGEGPVLDVGGEGSGCNHTFGRFLVKDIHVTEAGEVDRFWALYEQHCEDPSWPAVFGEVRIGEAATGAPEAVEPSAIEWPRTWVGETSAAVPVAVVAGPSGADVSSAALTGPGAGDFQIVSDGCLSVALAAGERCQLEVLTQPRVSGDRGASLVITDSSGAETATPLAVHAEPALGVGYASLVSEMGSWVGEGADYLFDRPREVFVDQVYGNGIIIYAESKSEWSTAEFRPASGHQLEVGEYNGALRSSEASPELSVSNRGHGCNTQAGRFVVRDVGRNPAGEVDRFRALYEEHCESSGAPAVFGEVSVGEPPPSTPEAVRPAEVEWPITPVGQATVAVPISVIAGEAGAEIRSVSLEGGAAADFRIAEDGCLKVALAFGDRCGLDVLAQPTKSGSRSAQLLIADASGARIVVPLSLFAEQAQEPVGSGAFEFLRQTGGRTYKLGKIVPVAFHLVANGRSDELETPTLQVAPETGYRAGQYQPATSVTNRGDVFASLKHGNYRYLLQTAGLATGPWLLRVRLADGRTHTTRITLR